VEENIVVHLLQQFDAESDGEDDGAVDGANIALPPLTTEAATKVVEVPAGLKPKGKQVWGPVQATRMSSRIQRDGRTAIEKAKDLKKAQNLELLKGKTHGFSNSFAALDNPILIDKAREAGISLGSCADQVELNINALKHVEIDRLSNFHADNPDMFLPVDISLTREDMVGPDASNYALHGGDIEDRSSDLDDDGETWVEVSSRRSSRRKLRFK
jgi:hypothetical protein